MSKKGRTIFFDGVGFAIVVFLRDDGKLALSWARSIPFGRKDDQHLWRFVPSCKHPT